MRFLQEIVNSNLKITNERLEKLSGEVSEFRIHPKAT